MSLISTPHSVRRVVNFHAARLGAALSVLHVAVEPPGIMGVDTTVLFAKLRGAAGPYMPFG